jgi:c-di-GMP-binding flagellar brake protein YcgR
LDRRSVIRFEIVGRLRGSLAADARVHLQNISRGGALIEAPWPLAQDSVHAIRIDSDEHFATVDARVCHVRQTYTGQQFLIGLEFLSIDEALGQHIERLAARQSSPNASSA